MSKVISININKNGGVPKHPVASAYVNKLNVVGDKQNDKKHHGGENRAVCLFSFELIMQLKKEGHPIFSGSTGENITIQGIDWNLMKLGARLSLGEVEIELTGPTSPCKTISNSFKEGDFSRISEKKHPGWSRWYAKVLKEGDIRINEEVCFL
ncbi:MAG: MOSC domain-containing protein [Crocinitomicaceae bacterium]|nr:MOSC domain-containing protein [Crocinitomicaceae bacterium]